ncbi:shikimate kinase [Novosphingobium sp. Gsoil 351]|uniref:shikimate kinase n=1 Tax=Novosphingobium sp. Gsoil 351 TaxID=2675225 RepID=UPI0012B4B747|nr:shikimate kinase [Novosphingobium sp. Gsoil 351]QGN53717.1 shikimate kinase [Novosphingobium sp. Gsoil 351]
MPEPSSPEATHPTPREIEALARRIDRPVVLVGLMGVGKTSVGRRLAAALRFGFVDADEAIEEAAQMTIPEIFEGFGEAYFRDGERRVIARLLDERPKGAGTVIATGGGAFVDPATRALILERGIAVWLDSDIDTLLDRVGRNSNRPLLRHGDPRETLQRLKAEREPYYREAPIHAASRPGPHQRTVGAILRELEKWQ